MWCKMAGVEFKELDEQGRIIIPKEWRERVLKGRKVIMKLKDYSVEIIPYGPLDLTEFFDKVEADVASDLSDWHAVKKELRRKGR